MLASYVNVRGRHSRLQRLALVLAVDDALVPAPDEAPGDIGRLANEHVSAPQLPVKSLVVEGCDAGAPREVLLGVEVLEGRGQGVRRGDVPGQVAFAGVGADGGVELGGGEGRVAAVHEDGGGLDGVAGAADEAGQEALPGPVAFYA